MPQRIRRSSWKRWRSRSPLSSALRAEVLAVALTPTRSPGLARLFAQQALRLEHHDQDEVGEHHRCGPRAAAHPVVRDLLDAADDEPAEHGPPEVADAAHHRGGEGDQARLEALEVPDGRLV